MSEDLKGRDIMTALQEEPIISPQAILAYADNPLWKQIPGENGYRPNGTGETTEDDPRERFPLFPDLTG